MKTVTKSVAGMDAQKRAHALLAAIATGAATGALALSGCGSGATKTVSVSSAVSPGATTQSTSTTSTTPSSTTTTTTTPTSTSTTANETGGAQATRTSTAPAFTKESASAEGLGAAQAVVKAHGFTAQETSDYRPEQTLRVLVGTREGPKQQAFFFVDGRYIGTDTSEPSARVKVLGQSDTEVTLGYSLYKPGDSPSDPTGGERTVHFQLNNGQLVALNPIPSAAARNG